MRRVLVRTEYDVGTYRVGVSLERPRRIRILMNAHAAEIESEARLEEFARGRVERRAAAQAGRRRGGRRGRAFGGRGGRGCGARSAGW